MEKHSWGARKSGIIDPKFTSKELGSYIQGGMDNGGAVTINLSILRDGKISDKALEVMRGDEKSGAVIVSLNNLINVDDIYGITKSHNQVVDVNDFVDHEN